MENVKKKKKVSFVDIGASQTLIAAVSQHVPIVELVANCCPCHYENLEEMSVSWEEFRDEYFPSMEISVDRMNQISANRRRVRIIAKTENATANC